MKYPHRFFRIISRRFGFGPAGRNLTVFPDDVFLVSYPKSGNTWLRFLIGNLLSNSMPITFLNIEQKIPDIYLNSDKNLLKLECPRILKSHEYFDPRYKKLVYIVRDPRDVAVSYYHHLAKKEIITDDYPLAKFVERFINGELDTYGSWSDNLNSWLGPRKTNPEFIIIRYEDLLENPKVCLEKIIPLIKRNVTQVDLQRAIHLSSADHMRELEKLQGEFWIPTQGTRKDKNFIRNANSGGWRHELPDLLVAKIEEKWTEPMKLMGYLN